MKIAFIISSRFGYTRKIANFIASEFITMNPKYEINFFNLAEYPLMREIMVGCDVIVVGASVRYGKFDKNLFKMSQKYAHILNQKKTAFYAVNLVARKEGKNNPYHNIYTRKFLDRTNWKPSLVAVFAGELNYPMYRFWDKQVIRLIMKLTGGETDTSQKIEYTNWNEVTEFAHCIL
ncbi:MAG: menaquinone-dependent protoporphyrinogen IX dehydrogenase [Neisseriaceae bacterium]|nr:MAG: menaquinone-dependent protoporphyrinogen IX dehydrogenase [Neisseriaceae bacterium]